MTTEYAIHPATGKVHLIRHPLNPLIGWTYCGLVIRNDAGWEIGDETLSGIRAICRSCKQDWSITFANTRRRDDGS